MWSPTANRRVLQLSATAYSSSWDARSVPSAMPNAAAASSHAQSIHAASSDGVRCRDPLPAVESCPRPWTITSGNGNCKWRRAASRGGTDTSHADAMDAPRVDRCRDVRNSCAQKNALSQSPPPASTGALTAALVTPYVRRRRFRAGTGASVCVAASHVLVLIWVAASRRVPPMVAITCDGMALCVLWRRMRLRLTS